MEFLSQENERLTSALVASREELSRLGALVGGAGVGSVAGMGNSNNGNTQAVGQPVSMPVPLQQKGDKPSSVAPASERVEGGKGYGY